MCVNTTRYVKDVIDRDKKWVYFNIELLTYKLGVTIKNHQNYNLKIYDNCLNITSKTQYLFGVFIFKAFGAGSSSVSYSSHK